MEKNILIVEDKEATLRMLEKLIREDVGGVAVFLARDYESALREAVLRNIDVFLIDIVLDTAVTDASGMRFAKRVREDENYLFTPIIFITGLEDPRLYAYKELHSFGYIEKPFAKENVVELVKDALRYQPRVREDENVYFPNDGILIAVKLSEIIYAEVQSHSLYIRLLNERIEIPHMTIKKFAVLTQRKGFIQCSRNTVINKRFIKNVDMVNRYISFKECKEQVGIGTVYKKKVYQELMDV